MTSSGTSLGFALDDVGSEVYNEAAFRHFLALERARVRHSRRAFFLLLVSLRRIPGTGDSVLLTFSDALFAGLGECLREGDFVGWYRDGRVAGAVLAQGPDAPADAAERIVHRVVSTLGAALPRAVAASLRIRVARGVRHTV